MITDHPFAHKSPIAAAEHAKTATLGDFRIFCAVDTCGGSYGDHQFKTPTEYQAHLLDIAGDSLSVMRMQTPAQGIAMRKTNAVIRSAYEIVGIELLAGQRIGTVGGPMMVAPTSAIIPVMYVLFYHKPQEDPSFHGVFATRRLAQDAMPHYDNNGPRIWGPPEGESGGDTWLLLPDGRMPTWYIQRFALNEFQEN